MTFANSWQSGSYPTLPEFEDLSAERHDPSTEGKALDSNADGLGLITTETEFPESRLLALVALLADKLAARQANRSK